MPKRALIEQRPWLVASLIAGIGYYFLADNPITEGVWGIALKGAGVGFLAIYALARTRGIDGAILVLALALAAAADMVLVINFEAGGALFFASHWVACGLYLRRRDASPSRGRVVTAAMLLIATAAMSYILSGDPSIALYSVALGAMAATAWTSRFALARVGAGALLFILSDWLIFSRFGPYDLSPLPDLLVWPTYYAGQFMIATGVVQALRAETPHGGESAHAKRSPV
jgi:uncharacterized membrane protein YhhN